MIIDIDETEVGLLLKDDGKAHRKGWMMGTRNTRTGPPAPNPTRPYSLGDPPDPPPLRGPDPSPGGTKRRDPVMLGVALSLITILGSFAVWAALGRHGPAYSVTCPDGSTYRATSVKPTEGMLKILDSRGQRVVLPGTCKAVQE